MELNKKTIRNILLMAAAVIAVWWLVNHFDLLLRILNAILSIITITYVDIFTKGNA